MKPELDGLNGNSQDAEEDSQEYPTGARLHLILTAVFLSVFLVALVTPTNLKDLPKPI